MLPATCSADTICFDEDQYRRVLQLAYQGKSCDSILQIRDEREKGMQVTINQQHRIIKRANRRKKIGGGIITLLGAAVVTEMLILVIKE